MMTMSQNEKSRIVLICNTDAPAAEIKNILQSDFEIHRIDNYSKLTSIPENPNLIINVVTEENNCSEICQQIGKIKSNDYTPVLLITNIHPEEEITSCIDDFIVTPIDTLELTTRVHSLIRIKELHDTLIRERDQAQTYIDIANCLVGVVDENMKLTVANKEASEALGYSQDEMLGQNWFDVFLPERVRDFIKAGYIQVLEGKLELPEFSEKPILTKNGEERLIFWHDVVLKDDNNQIIGTISSGEDITEQKQAEEILTQANQEYYVLDKMKNDFMANLSRELRTPIVSIKGFCKLLESDEIGSLNYEQKKALETVSRNSERLRHLVDSLLYTSDELVEQVKFDFCSVQIQEILENTIQDMETLASKKKISIENKISSLPMMWGDEDHLQRVFFHLLDNAIKFTPEKGTVKISASSKEDSVEILVNDTGIGIPSEKLDNIFRSFYQVDGSTTRKYSGTGVGLYICKKIIEQHMGELTVTSQEGIGSTFRISLPVKVSEIMPENFTKMPITPCGYNQ